MKKLSILLICLFAMLATSSGLKAQEVTVTLIPGWTWISYPSADTLDFATALGNFTPMQGDLIRSQSGQATYTNGRWRGSASQFHPGCGYQYKSNRQMPVQLTLGTPLPQLSVTTATPTDITATRAVVESTVTLGEGNHVFARGVCWGTEEMPTVDGRHASGEAVAGSQSIQIGGMNPGITYYVRAYAVTDHGLAYGNQQSFTTESLEIGYVDLGLPSGTLWATCNVGADTPEANGDYFAWGETQPKDTYDWNYQYCNGSDLALTKYCNDANYGYNGFTDDLTTLLSEDDAATANWGDDWRMPTKEEWLELYQNTTHTWTTQNGVNGCLFTATNGNSLFLPAAGYRDTSDLLDAGGAGYYWSSSLDTDFPPIAWNFYFDLLSCGICTAYGRGAGQSVRAVRVGQNTVPTGAINGKFTINNNGDQVYFSQGNLQYQPSSDTWRFAENQWDLIVTPEDMTSFFGDDEWQEFYADVTSQYTPTSNSWIDLFGWGTSGYNHGAVCYQPWSTNTNDSDYYAYGSYTYNLYDQTGQADWGYNAISNGGNQENLWRTLTKPECEYIFDSRNTVSGIRYAKAKVNGVNGLILLPDDWNSSIYNLNNANQRQASFSTNIISAVQWLCLEQNGAVFLPAAGSRGVQGDFESPTAVVGVGSVGSYWLSSTGWLSSTASGIAFWDFIIIINSDGDFERDCGNSVRLVRNVE